MVDPETRPETVPEEFGKSLTEQSLRLKHGAPSKVAEPETLLPLVVIVIEQFTVRFKEQLPAVQLVLSVPDHVPFQLNGPSWEIATVTPATLMAPFLGCPVVLASTV